MKKQYWVYDWETLLNCSLVVFNNYKTDETKVFVISSLKNDIIELLTFLNECSTNGDWHIGFNNLNFDAQITQYLLENQDMFAFEEGGTIASMIYSFSQNIIERKNNEEPNIYYEKDFSISQLDIFRINHWDNKNKSCSLKWAQFSMDWESIVDMPIHHSTLITTEEQIKEIISYCINDVLSTKNIVKLSKSAIDMRKNIMDKYNLNCLNYSNTKIGSELLLKLYCEKTRKNKWEVRKQRTIHSSIAVKDIIFKYVKFKSEILKNFHNKLNDIIFYGTKKEFKESVRFKGYEFSFAMGGIHQCIDPGVYLSNDEYIIMDADVGAMYPSIAVQNGMYPLHLGSEFYEVYKNDIVDVRLAEKAKKEHGDKAIVEGFKEAANASYGNSNQEHSWLFDSRYTMQTTINGQLMLLMIVENLLMSLENCKLLQTNTDGFTMIIKRSDLDKYYEICKSWEAITKLTLEYAEYSKMIISDVSSYIGLYTSGKVKCKGRFEWEDQQNHKPSHLHKNKSHLIVPKAIYHYFIHGILPEHYLRDNRNILDYCACVKAKGDWYMIERSISQGLMSNKKIQKIVRYYISHKGLKLIKVNKSDGREIQVESGKWMQTVFNKIEHKSWEDYGVNEDYYLDEIYKEIDNIQGTNKVKQLSLF